MRKGDRDYKSASEPTRATLYNLGYAEWHVRVELKGYQPQETGLAARRLNASRRPTFGRLTRP